MNLLTPLSLLFGLLAVPIVVMYMLKLRRKEVEVSSSLLWQMVLRDRQANAPWQRLRRNLLLFLQLTILALVVVGLARPAIPTPSVAAGAVIVLIDGSASMNATDAAPTRFEAAVAAARRLVEAMTPDSQMTVIVAGTRPQVLASAESERAALGEALSSARADQGPADWQAAFALASGAAAGGTAGQDATIVIISDGGLPDEGLPPLPGEVRYVPVGETGENLAISALAVRAAGSGAELFARVDNYGGAAIPAILSFYADETLIRSQEIDVPPGESESIVLPGLPGGEAVYRASLEAAGGRDEPLDAFGLDDHAFTVYQPAGDRRVLLITAAEGGNIFLEQVLAAMPGVTPYRAVRGADGSVTIPEDPFDVYIFDGETPAELPEGDLLLINPGDNPLFAASGVFTDTGGIRVVDSPITRFAELADMQVRQAKRVDLPDWGAALVEAEGGVLLFAGETGGRRVAVMPFDLHDSDLPLLYAFPVLMANLMEYLAPAQAFEAGAGLQPGDPLVIRPDPAVREVAVAAPDQQVYSAAPGEQGVLFSDTGILGLYAVNYISAETQWAEYFAVNLFNPGESDIEPAAEVKVGRAAIAPGTEDRLGQREFWPWLALAGLIVLVIEWLVYHRRQTIGGLVERLARRGAER